MIKVVDEMIAGKCGDNFCLLVDKATLRAVFIVATGHSLGR